MAIFSGKIIEAYYTDANNTTIEVIYKEGEKAINHYLSTEMDHPDFKDLIKEYPVTKIADTTISRNKEAYRQLDRVVEAKLKQKVEDKPMQNFDSVMEFVINYDPKKQAEQLFSLKLKIFEKDVIKDSNDNDTKTVIRQAKTPLDVLLAYREILEKNR